MKSRLCPFYFSLQMYSIVFIPFQIIATTIAHQTRTLLNSLVICAAFWLIFAIMGVQLFAGRFYKVSWCTKRSNCGQWCTHTHRQTHIAFQRTQFTANLYVCIAQGVIIHSPTIMCGARWQRTAHRTHEMNKKYSVLLL